jgi:hypothetical protein
MRVSEYLPDFKNCVARVSFNLVSLHGGVCVLSNPSCGIVS